MAGYATINNRTQLQQHKIFCWVIWGGCAVEVRSKSKWNVVTEIKAPVGSIYKKVCVHQFQSQDEDQIMIFWAFLVEFRLKIMLEEGIYEVWIFGLFRSKSSNWKHLRHTCTNCSVSQKIELFGERSFSMKCSI